MFGRGDERKRRGFGIFTLFRILLSLTMMVVLFLALIYALRYFAGNLTTKVPTNPKAFVLSLLTSEESASLIKSLLNFTPPFDNHSSKESSPAASSFPEPSQGTGAVILHFAVVADSHNNSEDLKEALAQARQMGAKFVVGVGDYTDVGTLADLQKAKDIFEQSLLPYYSTAGDHDLWDARNQGKDSITFYNQIFGPPYQSFGDSGVRFIILYNSDNYNGLGEIQMNWLNDELSRLDQYHPKATFAFMQEPLYHPSSDHFMGKVTPKLVGEAQSIARMLAQAHVAGVFYGDTHFFTKYADPKTGLKMVTTGAITRDRNLQPPRFVMVDVYDNGEFQVSDVEVK